MPRRIEEDDLAPFVNDGGGADVLRDTACLLRRYVRISDTVQKRCLSVINVAHHSNDWRSGNEMIATKNGSFHWNTDKSFAFRNFFGIVENNDIDVVNLAEHINDRFLQFCVRRHDNAGIKKNFNALFRRHPEKDAQISQSRTLGKLQNWSFIAGVLNAAQQGGRNACAEGFFDDLRNVSIDGTHMRFNIYSQIHQ